MDQNCWLVCICLVLLASSYSFYCQHHTSGYVYQLTSEPEKGSSLSSEQITWYHDCWLDNGCKYVAKVKKTELYVMLKSKEESENEDIDVVWKKRVEDVDECASDPCQNDGTCVDRIGQFECVCTIRYNGPLCEVAAWQASCLYPIDKDKPVNASTKESCLSTCITRKVDGIISASFSNEYKSCLCSTIDAVSYEPNFICILL